MVLKYSSQDQHCKKQCRPLFIIKGKAVASKVWLRQGKDPLPRFPVKDSMSSENLYVQSQQGAFEFYLFFSWWLHRWVTKPAIRSQACLRSEACHTGEVSRHRHTLWLSTNLTVFLRSESISLILGPALTSLGRVWPQQGHSVGLAPLTSVFIDFFFSLTWF